MNALELRIRQKWAKFCKEPIPICEWPTGKLNVVGLEIKPAVKALSNESVEDGEICDPFEPVAEKSVPKPCNGRLFLSVSPSSISSDGEIDEETQEEHLSKWPKTKHFTSFCRFFREGCCKKASECTFSHDISTHAAKRQPRLCKFYAQGNCVRKEMCPLLHGEFPCLDNYRGFCPNSPCRYSHLPLNDYTRPLIEQNLEATTAMTGPPIGSMFPRRPPFNFSPPQRSPFMHSYPQPNQHHPYPRPFVHAPANTWC